MKLDKRFVLAAALVMGIGFGVSACGGDDDGDSDAKKAIGEACEANDDCETGNCSEKVCAAKAEEKKCEKTADSCNAETETWNEKDCKCDPKSSEKTCELKAEDCSADAHQELDSEKCACACVSGYHFNNADTPVCEEDIVASENCNDGTVDADEVCDSKDGNIQFKEDYGTCVNYFKENGETVTAEAVTGTPSCGNTCKTLAKGTCAKVDDTCGNGKLDDGEFCDAVGEGDSKVVKFADDAAATCENANQGKFGKPGCNVTCDGYSKGTCSETEADTCKAEVAYDEATHKASATVTASNADTKTAIVCASKTANLAALIDNINEESSEFDTSNLKDAGDYVCYVVYLDKETKSLCSKDGAIIKLSDATAENAAIVSFKVESSISSETIAKWTFASATKDTIAEQLKEGIAADEGDKEHTKLSYVDNGKTGITITLTADNAGANALTALQVKVDSDGKLGNTQTEDDSAHISIGDLGMYTITGLKMTAKYEGGKIYVTAVDGSSEVIVKTIEDMTSSYAEKSVSGFASDIAKINIYGDDTVKKAMAIDDVAIEGAAKTL